MSVMSKYARICLFILLGFGGSPAKVYSMEMVVSGSIVTMKGDVIKGDCEKISSLIAGNKIQKIVLNNSNGGHADTGYCVGSLIRENKIQTSIKGRCVSSCSRMWLGGVSRDLQEGAAVGLHGNYSSNGHLISDAPERLRSWIPLFAPNVDRKLMEEWIHLPINNDMMYFFNDKAILCESGGCKPIKGRNAKNAGLSTK